MREGGHAKKYQKYVEAERGYLVARGWSGSFDDGHAYRLVPYLQSIESSVGSVPRVVRCSTTTTEP